MAVDFPGLDNNEISVGNPASLQITGAITVMCWAETMGVVQDTSLVTKFRSSPFRGFSLQTNIAAGPATVINFFIAPTDSTVLGSGNTSTNINGVVRHIAGVFRPSTSLEAWIDGVLEAQNTTGIPASQFDPAQNVVIGARNDGTLVFDGPIDDARIYNRALSPEEIQTITAARGHDGIVDGLVGRWLMDERAPGLAVSGAGTVRDASQEGNDGSPVGASALYAVSELSTRKHAA